MNKTVITLLGSAGLVAVGFAAGYFTKDYIDKKQREEEPVTLHNSEVTWTIAMPYNNSDSGVTTTFEGGSVTVDGETHDIPVPKAEEEPKKIFSVDTKKDYFDYARREDSPKEDDDAELISYLDDLAIKKVQKSKTKVLSEAAYMESEFPVESLLYFPDENRLEFARTGELVENREQYIGNWIEKFNFSLEDDQDVLYILNEDHHTIYEVLKEY